MIYKEKMVEGCTCPSTRKEYVGRLDTDPWNDPIVDGWPVVFEPFIGKRVRIVIEEIGDDPESYENLAKSFE